MDASDRDAIEVVLGRIPREAWRAFLEGEDGRQLNRRLEAARGALRAAGLIELGAPPKPVAEVIDLLGHRLLSDDVLGPWLRLQILLTMAPSKWNKLRSLFLEVEAQRAERLHGNMTQRGRGSEVLAGYWHRGSHWAFHFCDCAALPGALAERHERSLPRDEEIVPVSPLAPLHDFQLEAYRSLRRLLRNGEGRAAMLSLPTGAGKTRVTIEAICDHLTQEHEARSRRDIVLWISQRHELQEQAWSCFREVWQSPPERADGKRTRRAVAIQLVRLWGGRDPEELDLTTGPLVLVASIDQLGSWVRRRPAFFEMFPSRRLVCTVVDEAHSLITREHRNVLQALRQRLRSQWKTVPGAAPVVGLTATPWRKDDRESRALMRFFRSRLLHPKSLGNHPVAHLQRRAILSRVQYQRLRVKDTPPMSAAQWRRFEQFHELPNDYLEKLGDEHGRNAEILHRLRRLPKRSRVLVFACSVAHAEVLTVALNRACGDGSAAVVTATTPRAERAEVIERFRNGRGLRFLCNVGVLTTGFDAPKADVVCITRPTTSAAFYEQMVGRGLRGPKNGGTRTCLVIDVQDEGLPKEIMSYERVLSLWQ